MKPVSVVSNAILSEDLYQKAEHFLLDTVQSHKPAVYHFNTGGQRMRMRTCLDACVALGIAPDDSIILSCSIELLHNASLIHDDLQDRDKTRREHPTVWAKYGDNIAICSGDFLLTKAFGILPLLSAEVPLKEVIEEVQQAVTNTIHGQCLDVSLPKVESEDQYEQIAAGKSGPLIGLPIILPLLAAGLSSYVSNTREAIRCFAIAYQIADDVGDWQADADFRHLNLVNLYREHHSLNKSILIAKQRALHLIELCERELASLPNDCAAGVIAASKVISQKLWSS